MEYPRLIVRVEQEMEAMGRSALGFPAHRLLQNEHRLEDWLSRVGGVAVCDLASTSFSVGEQEIPQSQHGPDTLYCDRNVTGM